MERTALVTGGAGFIGSHMVERLVTEGWTVKVLDNFSSGFHSNLAPFVGKIEVIEGDVRSMDACRRACAGVKAIFHMAAIASVASSVDDPILSHEVTLGGTLNLLVAARDAGVKRFVFSSSASVYGNAETVPTLESQPIDPQSPYASAKAAGELYARNFAALYGLETVVLRYFNVFGPRQSATSGYAAAIPLFVKAALTGAKPTIFGDGKQTRDFVYVSNIVDANYLAATVEGVAGETFNVGAGRQIDLLELLQKLEAVTGADLSPNFAPQRAGEVKHSRADIGHAVEKLGFRPTVELQEGLAHTVAATKLL